MTEHDLRDTVRSMSGSLDEVRREQGWRSIERALANPPAAPPARWHWLAIPALAAAILLAIWLWPRTESAPVALAEPPTTLAAKSGERAVFARDGVTLTLIGPGTATVQTSPSALRVAVAEGTVLGERTTDDAPAIELAAGGNTTTTRDPQFAIHVAPGTVVLGTGQRALAMIERETHVLAPPAPAPMIEPSPVPIQPAPVEPPSKPAVERTAPPPSSPKPAVDRTTPPSNEPVLLPGVIEIPVDAKELYARAEAALYVRDPGTAKQFLRRLLVEFPTDPMIDAARYDLALIAIANHEPAVASGWLQQVIDSAKDPALRLAAKKLLATLK